MIAILPTEGPSSAPIPKVLHGYVSVRSQGGTSILDAAPADLASSAQGFHGTRDGFNQARKALESIGFLILAESRLGIAVAGPPEAYEELSGGKLETVERLMQGASNRTRYVTHVDIKGPNQPAALGVGITGSAAPGIEAILLERPRLYHGTSPSPVAPNVGSFHLRVPNDVALCLNAIPAHHAGVRGEGIKVAMVDSGQYPHPYFIAHHYSIRLPPISVVPGTSPHKDPVGHGTGESANIFAVAPGATLIPIRASDDRGALVGSNAGFLRAKQEKPEIITCSWGGDSPGPPFAAPSQWTLTWLAEIQDAVDQGIFVVFSAGNGSFSPEGQAPGVFSAGGVYVSADLDAQASNYASGYSSPWFTNRVVPDACGLVGMMPRAQYIMLPVQPGCDLDRGESQPSDTDPNTDGTAGNDGWALFSGTSAAAPQIAGAAALILSACPGLSPAQVRTALVATATDITTGRCHQRFNNLATDGPDLATGAGLVNAWEAVKFARANFGGGPPPSHGAGGSAPPPSPPPSPAPPSPASSATTGKSANKTARRARKGEPRTKRG
jgi:subtilisin family serine protease